MRRIGQFLEYEQGKYLFSWPGSTIEEGFYGTEISARMDAKPTGQSDEYFDVLQIQVDDEIPTRIRLEKGERVYTLASGLKDGLHRIRLVKLTETMVGTMYFHGFEYGNGRPGPLPAPNTRRIEVYGDSITAGYGNEADGTVDSAFRGSTQNAYKTYGMITGRMLQADVTLFACSGMGLYQNIGGARRAGNFFDTFGGYAPMGYDVPRENWKPGKEPDIMIINLGTNDFASGVDPELFLAEYHRSMDEIRSFYPGSDIVCCVGTMIYNQSVMVRRLVDERTQAGDTHIFYYEFQPMAPENGIGAGGHPSAKTHQAMSGELVPFIREIKEW